MGKDLPMKWQCEILIVAVVVVITLPSLLLVGAFTTVSTIATATKQNWRIKSVVLLQINDDTFEDDVITSHNIDGYIHQCRRRDFMISLLSSSTIIPLSAAATTEEEQSCQKGKIVSESPVPGAYSQVCMNLDERTFTLTSIEEDNSITVYQGTNSGAGEVAGRTGVAVWNSGILLTRLLDKLNESTKQSIFKEKSIIELGCGVGLASLATAKLGASSVLATDANTEVIELAQRNIEQNNLNSIVKTTALQWGLMDATEYESSADIVIGSDLTYNSGSWVVLAETMSTILKQDGIVIYLTLGHSGFNVGGELGGFLSVAENTGMRVLTKEDVEWKANLGDVQSVNELLTSIVTSEERAVIDANGGARVVILGKKRFGRKG